MGGTLAGFQATFMMLFEVGAQNAIIDKFSQRAGSDIVAGLSAQFFTHLFKDRIAEYHLGKRLGGRGSLRLPKFVDVLTLESLSAQVEESVHL